MELWYTDKHTDDVSFSTGGFSLFAITYTVKFIKLDGVINLNFTDTDFKRASDGDEFYGIRVRQEYFSNTYGDVGYLFLLVDLRFDEPIIHVRAWQNDKLPLDALFGLSDVY